MHFNIQPVGIQFSSFKLLSWFEVCSPLHTFSNVVTRTTQFNTKILPVVPECSVLIVNLLPRGYTLVSIVCHNRYYVSVINSVTGVFKTTKNSLFH